MFVVNFRYGSQMTYTKAKILNVFKSILYAQSSRCGDFCVTALLIRQCLLNPADNVQNRFNNFTNFQIEINVFHHFSQAVDSFLVYQHFLIFTSCDVEKILMCGCLCFIT